MHDGRVYGCTVRRGACMTVKCCQVQGAEHQVHQGARVV